MRPPICAVCDEECFPPDGDLVEFTPADEDRAALERMKSGEIVGHPPNLDWFCNRHIERARAFAHLKLPEAMARMRAE